MSRGKVACLLAILVATVGGLVSTAAAQDAQPTREEMIAARLKEQGITVDPEQIRAIGDSIRSGQPVDPEALKKIMGDVATQVKAQAQTKLKVSLGVTDEEWAILAPKIDKVQSLTVQDGAVGQAMARFGLNAGAFTGTASPAAADVQQKLQALQKVLNNKDASSDEIRSALKAYRESKTNAKVELEKARTELKELLTLWQEAKLVMSGLLE